jgi:hypothetical protein
MPTSKTRPGYDAANGASPVGSSIEAVIATMSDRCAATAHSSSLNTEVQLRPGCGEPGLTWCSLSSSCRSAAA